MESLRARTAFMALTRKIFILLRRGALVHAFTFYLIPVVLIFLIGIGRFGLISSELGIGDPVQIMSSFSEYVTPGQKLVWSNMSGESVPSSVLSAIVGNGQYEVEVYPDHDSLLSACSIQSHIVKPRCFAGVTFHSFHQGASFGINYTLSLPGSALSFAPNSAGTGLDGWLALQNVIERAASALAAPASLMQDLQHSKLYNMPFTALTKAQFNHLYYGYFYKFLGNVGAAAVVFVFLPHVFWLVTAMVKEVDLNLREALFIAGVRSHVYFGSYFFVSVLIFSPHWLIVSAISWGMLFPTSAFTSVLALVALSGFGILSFCLVLITFFTKARLAGAISCGVVASLGAVGIAAVQGPAIAQIIVSLFLCPSGLVVGFYMLAQAEMNALGVNSPSSFWYSSIGNTDLTFGALLVIMTANIFVNIMVTYYLTLSQAQNGNVFTRIVSIFKRQKTAPMVSRPSDDAVILDDCQIADESAAVARGVIYQPWDAAASPVLRIRRLHKQYPSATVAAVSEVSLDLHQGTVLSLLGQNGCGKTTLMSMLAGLRSVTRGNAYFDFHCRVDGGVSTLRLDKDIAEIRRSLGFCPQHDILWPEITVLEHLKIFAAIKGVPSKQILSEANQWMDRVGLSEKRDFVVHQLSGGQKRRLSVAIAFIGGSKIVFLDEPTAGVDPLSRRALWEIIQANTAGRTIVLSTHFLDEAEFLGSRVALLSMGKLLALGTPVFLKQQLGLGYHLTCTLFAEKFGCVNPIACLVRSIIPAAVPHCNSGRDIVFKLPADGDQKIPALLRALEQGGEAAHVESFGVSSASLQDIYMELLTSEKMRAEEENSGLRPVALVSETAMNVLAIDEPALPPSSLARPREPSSSRRIITLCWKRWLLASRDRRFALLPIILSAILAVVLPTVFHGLEFITCPASLMKVIPPTPLTASVASAPSFLVGSSFISALGVEASPISLPSSMMISVSPSDFLSDISASAASIFGGVAFPHSVLGPSSVSNGWPDLVAASSADIQFADAATVNIINNMLLRNVSSCQTSNCSPLIVASYQPFPQLESAADLIDWTRYFAYQIVTLLGWSLLISLASTLPIVKETAMGAKLSQRAAGVTMFQYWAANFLWDSLHLFLCSLIFSAGLVSVKGWVPNFFITFLVVWLGAIAGSELGYLLSFAVSSPASALAALSGYFFLVTIGVFVGIVTQLGSVGPTAGQYGSIIWWVATGGMIINPITSVMQAQFSGLNIFLLSCGGGSDMWSFSQIGRPLAILCGQILVFACIVLLLEAIKDHRISSAAARAATAAENAITNEDEDIKIEQIAASSYAINPKKDLGSIVVSGLRKTFGGGKIIAVDDLSLLMPYSEVFVLLGANGSGKTTALRILCGQEAPSAGDILLSTFSLRTDLRAICRVIGVCPQFDVLYDALTPREHLTLYSAFRGLQGPDVEAEVNWLLKAVDLHTFSDRPAVALSGGNRRKLSLALACVGSPPVLVLDEPSTGMDPLTMRLMWRLIRSLGERHTIILTTHSMEEAEGVASRVGIMSRGRFAALGTVQRLKSRFGAMFQLDAEASDSNAAAGLVSMMSASLFPGAEQLQLHGVHLSIRIPAVSTITGGSNLGMLFEFASSLRERGDLVDFRVSQTTLERIFVDVVEKAEKNRLVSVLNLAPMPIICAHYDLSRH